MESYLPTESIKGFKDEVTEFFLAMARKNSDNTLFSSFCISNTINFVASKESLELVSGWVLDGEVSVDGVQLNCQLS